MLKKITFWTSVIAGGNKKNKIQQEKTMKQEYDNIQNNNTEENNNIKCNFYKKTTLFYDLQIEEMTKLKCLENESPLYSMFSTDLDRESDKEYNFIFLKKMSYVSELKISKYIKKQIIESFLKKPIKFSSKNLNKMLKDNKTQSFLPILCPVQDKGLTFLDIKEDLNDKKELGSFIKSHFVFSFQKDNKVYFPTKIEIIMSSKEKMGKPEKTEKAAKKARFLLGNLLPHLQNAGLEFKKSPKKFIEETIIIINCHQLYY